MKTRKMKRNATKEHNILSLPSDLLEEVLLVLLSSSLSPIRDIKHFSTICKEFNVICSSKRVGKCMRVEDWNMHWHNKEDYFGFLQNCAESENINALFLLGLEEMFNQGRFYVGLNHLILAASKEHLLSKYIMGLLLFREDSSRSHGIKILNEISNNLNHCRKQASKIFKMMTWKKWPNLSLNRCKDSLCGAPILGGDNLWLCEGRMKRRFCCDTCRWTHEYKMFVAMRYLSL